MTFEAREESIQDSRPSELYDISIANTNFFFTNSEVSRVIGPRSYVPVVISRSQPRVSQDEPGSEVELTLATNEPAVQALTRAWVTASPESLSSRVLIQKNHFADSAYQPFWIGSIVAASYRNEGHETVFLCRSLDNLFTLQGPRRNWGTLCTHQHYDSFCTLNSLLFVKTGVVSAIDATGTIYTVPGIAAPTVRWQSGEFRKPFTFSSRMIINQTGNDFTLQYPIPEIGVGDTIEVIEGCLHDVDDCKSFSNLLNYGGIPYTPDINPFTSDGGLEDL